MKQTLITIFCLMALSFQACKEKAETPQKHDYLLFGTYRGHCDGPNCIVFYKLENGNLYQSESQIYPIANVFYNGPFKQLSKEQYNQVKDIEQVFPIDFLNANNQIIGCPDCADTGGIYIEICKNGITKNWFIDKDKSKVPNDLYAFLDAFWLKIEFLKESIALDNHQ